MRVEFKTKQLERVLCSEREMIKKFGDRAGKIKIRMGMLVSAKNLAEIPHIPPYNRHELKGQKAGQFAVDINKNFRLLFEPNHHPIPLKPDGGYDLVQITSIKILGVEDYH